MDIQPSLNIHVFKYVDSTRKKKKCTTVIHIYREKKKLPITTVIEFRPEIERESCSFLCSVVSDSLRPHGLFSPWNSPGQNTGVGSLPFSKGSFQLRIESRYPTLHSICLPAEPQEKPKNIGVGSLSHLQRIFPTQESNQGLLHCRQILYQLSCEESLFSVLILT